MLRWDSGNHQRCSQSSFFKKSTPPRDQFLPPIETASRYWSYQHYLYTHRAAAEAAERATIAARHLEEEAAAKRLDEINKQIQAQSSRGGNWFTRAVDGVQRHWGAISSGLSIAGLGICIIASAGTCVIAGVAIAGITFAHNTIQAGTLRDPYAWEELGPDVVSVGVLGYLGKGATAGWKVAPTGERLAEVSRVRLSGAGVSWDSCA